jgi:AraC family transcriptional regulator
LLVDSLKTTLAIHLLRKYCTTKPKLSSYGDGLSKSKLREVTEYIDANLERNLQIIEQPFQGVCFWSFFWDKILAVET